MNRRASLLAALALTALAGAAVAPRVIRLSGAEAATGPATPLTAPLRGPDGAALGEATLTDGPRGVLIRLRAEGLPPGRHGVHLHASGDCGDRAFARAGGHLHQTSTSVHGLLNPAATDNGDLTNVTVGADGRLDAELFTTFVGLAPAEGRANLIDADGAALIVHADVDDHLSQPIGGAGARIACAVIGGAG